MVERLWARAAKVLFCFAFSLDLPDVVHLSPIKGIPNVNGGSRMTFNAFGIWFLLEQVVRRASQSITKVFQFMWVQFSSREDVDPWLVIGRLGFQTVGESGLPFKVPVVYGKYVHCTMYRDHFLFQEFLTISWTSTTVGTTGSTLASFKSYK